MAGLSIEVRISRAAGVEAPASSNGATVEIMYARLAQLASDRKPVSIVEVARVDLDASLEGSTILVDVAPESSLEARFLGPTGATRVTKTAAIGRAADKVVIELAKEDVLALTASEPLLLPVMATTRERVGRLGRPGEAADRLGRDRRGHGGRGYRTCPGPGRACRPGWKRARAGSGLTPPPAPRRG
jgi:hypothetical protein